jgi:hypothetical protein
VSWSLGLSDSTLGLSDSTLGLSDSTLGLSDSTLGLSDSTLGLSDSTLGLKLKYRCGADSTAAVEADCAVTPISSFIHLQGRCTPYGARPPLLAKEGNVTNEWI